MKIRLETIANLTIIVTGLTVTTLLLSRVIADYRQPPRPAVPDYQVGETLPAAFPVDFRKTPQTLLLVLSSQCHYCTDSVPFYRDLLSARANGGSDTRFVAVGLETRATLEDYLKQHQLVFDEVVSLPREAIKFRGTPTLLLVDNSSVVKGVWSGFLSSEQRRDQVVQLVMSRQAKRASS
jgi:hypothetical protein